MRKLKSCGVLVFRKQPHCSFSLMKHPHRYDLPKGHIEIRCSEQFKSTSRNSVGAHLRDGLRIAADAQQRSSPLGRRQQQDARIGYDAPELRPWAGSPDDRSFNLRELNPAYFARLRELVSYAESKQIVVLITVRFAPPFAGDAVLHLRRKGP